MSKFEHTEKVKLKHPHITKFKRWCLSYGINRLSFEMGISRQLIYYWFWGASAPKGAELEFLTIVSPFNKTFFNELAKAVKDHLTSHKNKRKMDRIRLRLSLMKERANLR